MLLPAKLKKPMPGYQSWWLMGNNTYLAGKDLSAMICEYVEAKQKNVERRCEHNFRISSIYGDAG